MRLQLILAVSATLAATAGVSSARAEDPSASASVGVYSDTDHMVVISPRAGARGELSERISIEASTVVDVISGASVDVVSEASPTAIHEVRVEGALGLGCRPTRTVVCRVRGRVSHEDDYLSAGAEVGAAIELRQRTTTVDVGLSGASDRVEAVTRPDFSERRTELRLVASVTQVVDPRTYVDAILEGHRRAGYLASPYRTVPLFGPDTPMITRVDEAVPDERMAAAGALVLRRAITPWLFARLSYRYYRDDWGVSSHTVRARCALERERWSGGLEARAYVQTKADFYREHYELESGLVPELRTRDRRLGAMVSAMSTLTVARVLSPEWRAVASIGAVRFRWLDFAAQQRRDALIGTVGVNRGF